MGAMKPQYDRIQQNKCNISSEHLTETTNSTNSISTCNKGEEYCLSWMKDSQNHREDLLARQMRKRNEQRYAPRWTNINR